MVARAPGPLDLIYTTVHNQNNESVTINCIQFSGLMFSNISTLFLNAVPLCKHSKSIQKFLYLPAETIGVKNKFCYAKTLFCVI